MSAIYSGPQCPYCAMPLAEETLRTGTASCQYCQRVFEATVFQARERLHEAVQVATATPDGAAAACANHPGNAAATSCRRCGLFICTLCEMNVGDGAYCPSCFDRIRAEGTLRGVSKKRVDYAMLARTSALLGILPCLWGVPAPLCIWWAVKGIGQRREEGASTAGMVFVLIVGIAELLGYMGFFGFMVYSIFNTARGAGS